MSCVNAACSSIMIMIHTRKNRQKFTEVLQKVSLKKLIQHLTTTKRRRKSPALLQEPRASPKPFPAGVLKMFCARAIFLLRLSPCKDCPSILRYDYDYAFLADDGRARLEPSTESCVPPALLDPSCCCCCCCTSRAYCSSTPPP